MWVNWRCATFILELVQFERQKMKDACRDAENAKAKEVRFTLSCGLYTTAVFVAW